MPNPNVEQIRDEVVNMCFSMRKQRMLDILLKVDQLIEAVRNKAIDDCIEALPGKATKEKTLERVLGAFGDNPEHGKEFWNAGWDSYRSNARVSLSKLADLDSKYKE